MNDEHYRILTEGGVEEWNRWREENPGVTPDLYRAQFTRMDLTEANLKNAFLDGADLTGANLANADLSKSTLRNANLTWCTLYKANLTKCTLFNTFINDVELTATNFSNSAFRMTNLIDLDLRKPLGLESTVHLGPSTIGIDTIYRSQGRISRTFLKNCGLDDIFIDYIPDLIAAAKPIQFYSCFLSYNSKDEDFATRLYADLRKNSVNCWYAPEDMQTGRAIRESVHVAIKDHEKLLLVLSPNSLKSRYVRTEVEKALTQETFTDNGELICKLFPISIVPVDDLPQSPLLQDIKSTYHIGDFSNHTDESTYQKALERLLRDLYTSAEREEGRAPNTPNGLSAR